MVASTSDCSGGMVGFRPREAIHQLADILDWELGCASNAVKFIRALEGDVDADSGTVFKPLRTDVVGRGELGITPEYKLSPAAEHGLAILPATWFFSLPMRSGTPSCRIWLGACRERFRTRPTTYSRRCRWMTDGKG
jgi:hypothetical protein